jgi:putative serine protease PepD
MTETWNQQNPQNPQNQPDPGDRPSEDRPYPPYSSGSSGSSGFWTDQPAPGQAGAQYGARTETETLPRYGGYDPYGTTPPPEDEPAPPAESGRPRRGVALLAAVALAAGLIGGGAGAVIENQFDDAPVVNSLQGAPVSGTGSAGTQTGTVSRVAAAVLPSVVKITVAGSGGSGEGSGVVISSNGLILTNNHVVAAAAQGGRLQVSFQDGKKADAEIVGRDPSSDLAVIRAEGVSGLQAAALGRSADLAVGEQVVAIGSPLGLSGTVTTGIVSALDRPVRAGGSPGPGGDTQSTVLNAIQTDAAINPGNSGGPLVNMRGQVVGINSAIATLGGGGLGGSPSGSIGLGFAIPIDTARPIADQLSTKGVATHAVLGVNATNTDPNGAVSGALIRDVVAGGGAAAAGLRAGDVVTKIGDRVIDSSDALVAAVRSEQPGAKVNLTYVRDGQTRTVSVTLGSRSGN